VISLLFQESQSNLVASIEEQLRVLTTEWEKFLRSKGSISPELPGCSFKLSRVRKYKDAFLLHLLVHYIEDEEIQWIVKAELLDVQRQFAVEERGILNILLKSKAHMLLYIIESSEFKNPREFFGSILEYRGKMEKWQLYIFRPRKAKKQTRRRGYRDHGSLKPTHKWSETHDWTLTEKQQEIEESREIIKDTLDFLEGGIT
jgi:hypothetical protein